ncbi:hypothetical protein COT51_02900 [candidate division WWE3 bacterium CG08_land_8_20_14_0_20_41_15]|uniref:Carrier domain-containing protein n=1 Tax=candidate division WWE3 bacterium CG08_land_8_20_14_0_20_41_15 TaxID=1975086 RepID=A0A2H0X913_UNCKA|nr:MAG: hypothetical protein COT51_02900 [candidate division WWE3 bacterium CG08_land_8_20_14_0_20_41_15]
MTEDFFNTIKGIIAKIAGADEETITQEADFSKDLNLDPVEKAEVFASVLAHYNVVIDQEEQANINRVSELIDAITDNLP